MEILHFFFKRELKNLHDLFDIFHCPLVLFSTKNVGKTVAPSPNYNMNGGKAVAQLRVGAEAIL